MIEVFRHNQKWRMNIRNETFEFEDYEQFKELFDVFLQLKEELEPHKENGK